MNINGGKTRLVVLSVKIIVLKSVKPENRIMHYLNRIDGVIVYFSAMRAALGVRAKLIVSESG